MALLGASGLLFRSAYRGPLHEAVFAQGGNIAVSFALYFVALNATARHGFGRIAAAGATLLAVEAFEVTNGFGLMANTYDRLDFAANAIGVALAVVADLTSSRFLKRWWNGC